MSPSIWTRCAGRSRLRRLAGRAWRVVEYQYLVSTRKLVDSDEEQRVLEELIEGVKPPPPSEARGLHFLLYTPFRYPPLTRGSRLRSRLEPGVWYGSRDERTAFAEVAYYRLLFLEGTTARLGRLEVDLSAFQAAYAIARGADLTREPFDAYREAISSPTSYAESQPLAAEMRADGAGGARYFSARDAPGGVNVALLTPAAFAAKRPSALETWACVATREYVEVIKKDVFSRAALRFPREQFTVAGRLPRPGT